MSPKAYRQQYQKDSGVIQANLDVLVPQCHGVLTL